MAFLIGVAIGSWRRKPSLGLLAGYFVLILAETVLIRQPYVGAHFQPELFWSWREWDKQREQILTNIVMFVPVGLLAGRLREWRGFLLAAGMSAVIEVLQLVTARGLIEFDDVMHNVFGAAIGIGPVIAVSRIKGEEEQG